MSLVHTITKAKNSGLVPLFLIVLSCVRKMAIVSLVFLSACQEAPTHKQVTFSGPIMGTDYRISALVGVATDLNVLEQDILNAMQAVNQSMSTYIDDSELNQFNRASADQMIALSPALVDVLTESLAISRMSSGAFDVTLAKVIDLWGFGPDGRATQRPSAQQLADLRGSVGYEKIKISNQQATKTVDELRVDLSAIAKGYAVDQVAHTLLTNNVTGFLINIGGELRGAGRKLDGSVWQVGIEKPHALGGIQEIVMLDNQAIATSGDYRNFYTIDGEQYSHTIDPTTLSPVFHKLALVSVLADTAMRADGLATAMLAMGEVRAQAFAKQHDLAAYMIIRESGTEQYRIVVTDKFNSVLQ